MSALMAVLVPLFPCVEGLYHVIDPDEGTRRYRFKSIEEILDLPDGDRLSYFLLTDDQLERLKLVEIPYEEHQQVSEEYRSRLHTLPDMADLDDWWADSMEFLEHVEEDDVGTGQVLEVMLTKRAAEQFEEMWKYDRTRAREFKFALERLHFTTMARRNAHDAYTRKLRQGEHDIYSINLSTLTFHQKILSWRPWASALGRKRKASADAHFHFSPGVLEYS